MDAVDTDGAETAAVVMGLVEPNMLTDAVIDVDAAEDAVADTVADAVVDADPAIAVDVAVNADATNVDAAEDAVADTIAVAVVDADPAIEVNVAVEADADTTDDAAVAAVAVAIDMVKLLGMIKEMVPGLGHMIQLNPA